MSMSLDCRLQHHNFAEIDAIVVLESTSFRRLFDNSFLTGYYSVLARDRRTYVEDEDEEEVRPVETILWRTTFDESKK